MGDFRSGLNLTFLGKYWIRLLKTYDNLIGVKWAWQSLDSISIKSPLGGQWPGNNPTLDANWAQNDML